MPDPRDHYVPVHPIGDDGDVLVQRLTDIEAARAEAKRAIGEDYLDHCVGRVGWWRKVPCRTGEWQWWLRAAEPHARGAFTGVYFSPDGLG